MDPVSTAFSVIEGIIRVISLAKASGMLGGTSTWIAYAEDLAATVGNFRGFVMTMVNDPSEYDRIAALPQAEQEAEIRRRLYPEGWDEKEARIKRELGLG
jgi:hypothetical protein